MQGMMDTVLNLGLNDEVRKPAEPSSQHCVAAMLAQRRLMPAKLCIQSGAALALAHSGAATPEPTPS